MGRPKQLLPVGGMRLLDIVLGETLRSDLDTVVLVLGHMAEDIMAGLSTDLHHPRLRIIENNRFMEGISSSIIAGLSEVEDARYSIQQGFIEVRAKKDVEAQLKLACEMFGAGYRTKMKKSDIF